MAVNPMQRRARNSFLIGFLVALIIMAIVVLFLLYRMKAINDAKEALEALQSKVLVASDDLESGQLVTLEDNFKTATVQSTVDKTAIISDDDFLFYNEDGEVISKYNEDGSEIQKELMMKIDVPAGTIVTKDMVTEVDNQIDNTDRIMEYNMIVLPSKLKNGDHVDIRLSLPNGQDFIIIAKKRVLGCTSTTLWIEANELEIELLNSAIVETYAMMGAKLYATLYTEAGTQQASSPTYIASTEVMREIENNPNIIEKAKNEYATRIYNFSTYRTDYFQPLLDENADQKSALVESGINTEIEKIQAARQEYVDELQGTEAIGYTR